METVFLIGILLAGLLLIYMTLTNLPTTPIQHTHPVTGAKGP